MNNQESSSLRALMPALQNKKYFNYGGQGPLPKPSLEAITASWQKIQDLGPFTNKVWPYVSSELDATKQYLAKICGVNKQRIALTENVTSGCVLPLLGLPFLKGDRLLISDCEHPGVVSACMELARRKELKIDLLPVKQLRNGVDKVKETEQVLLESVEKELKPSTKLVVLSHLLWNTGQIISISAVADMLSNHPNHPFLLVDAAQSFAHIPITEDVAKADIYAFTGHKWACGPEGLGAVVISERVLIKSNPTIIGWRSLQHEGSINIETPSPFHLDGRRYEIATSCIPLLAGLRSSLELLKQEGTDIERLGKIQEKSYKLWERLHQLPGVTTILKGPPPAGLVSFNLIQCGSTKRIVNHLGNKDLWVRDLESPVCLRACLHVTSEEEEITLLLKAIEELATIN